MNFDMMIWGIIIGFIGSLLIIGRLYYKIWKVESRINVIIRQLKRKNICGFSMLEIFNALKYSFALGLTYPQIHSILTTKTSMDIGWGTWSSDILSTFTILKLIHTCSIDPGYSVWLDNKRTIPNYVYQLTETGKLLADKLINQKLKTGKAGVSQYRGI